MCQTPGSYLDPLIMGCYVVSLVSTLGISLDKYISVQYSLRYHSIVTCKRVMTSIGLVWIVSGCMEAFLVILCTITNEPKYFHFTNYIAILPGCVVLMACGLHIQRYFVFLMKFKKDKRSKIIKINLVIFRNCGFFSLGIV